MVYFCDEVSFLCLFKINIKKILLGTHCMSIFVEYIQEKGACLCVNLNIVCNVW